MIADRSRSSSGTICEGRIGSKGPCTRCATFWSPRSPLVTPASRRSNTGSTSRSHRPKMRPAPCTCLGQHLAGTVSRPTRLRSRRRRLGRFCLRRRRNRHGSSFTLSTCRSSHQRLAESVRHPPWQVVDGSGGGGRSSNCSGGHLTDKGYGTLTISGGGTAQSDGDESNGVGRVELRRFAPSEVVPC